MDHKGEQHRALRAAEHEIKPRGRPHPLGPISIAFDRSKLNHTNDSQDLRTLSHLSPSCLSAAEFGVDLNRSLVTCSQHVPSVITAVGAVIRALDALGRTDVMPFVYRLCTLQGQVEFKSKRRKWQPRTHIYMLQYSHHQQQQSEFDFTCNTST